MQKNNKQYALDLSHHEWQEWCSKIRVFPYTSRQILKWLFEKQITDPNLFTNLPKHLREQLITSFDWRLPTIDTLLKSSVDNSQKFLLKTHDNNYAECVLMPENNRITLCVSSQVGCKLACTFCQTGRLGFFRNLTSGEILSQILIGNQILKKQDTNRKITNIVFMGMGEPLDNYDQVVKACHIMVDKQLLSLSNHRVTISTAGIVPKIKQLGEELPVNLAISLHSADNAHRSSMMPINRMYPLEELKTVLLDYPIQTRHGITFEYVMIHNENDTLAHAKKLVTFLHGLKAKVNLIPMNPHPGNIMEAAIPKQIKIFQQYLSDRSIPAPIRYSRGQDISAACGQLALKRKDELNLPPKEISIARRREQKILNQLLYQ